MNFTEVTTTPFLYGALLVPLVGAALAALVRVEPARMQRRALWLLAVGAAGLFGVFILYCVLSRVAGPPFWPPDSQDRSFYVGALAVWLSLFAALGFASVATGRRVWGIVARLVPLTLISAIGGFIYLIIWSCLALGECL